MSSVLVDGLKEDSLFTDEDSKEGDMHETNDPVVQYMYELIDICTLGVCFDIHRSLRLGHWELDMIDDEGQKEFEIVCQPGLDVFGQQPVKKLQECICPKCQRNLAANRFAPHLEKCMGMGRNSSRIASRRLQATGQIELDHIENEIDYDWAYDFDKKNRKLKKDKEKITNSPRRPKIKKVNQSSDVISSVQLINVTSNGGGSRPGTPGSTASGDISGNVKAGPTLQALETLSQEEKVALLTQTCGAISEHTGKMCTRTGRCVQHSDEQRRSVRELLLGDFEDVPWPPSMRPEGPGILEQDDIHVDVDGYEDIEGGPLLRDFTQLSWEQESNVSTGSDTMNAATTVATTSSTVLSNSPVVTKTKKSKGRKSRSR